MEACFDAEYEQLCNYDAEAADCYYDAEVEDCFYFKVKFSRISYCQTCVNFVKALFVQVKSPS